MPLNYNAPIAGQKSSIDGTGSDQMNSFFWLRKSLIEARKEQYFMPLASVTNMPKHYGKDIKVHEYVPLLDDRNVNDQGLDAAGAVIVDGNLYGSSKDVGTISGKLPTLTENGGRVNRVGFTRLQRTGSIQKLGFFYEFTKESLDFDSDPELMQHLSRELMNGATQLTEAMLQIDLLNAAGTVVYSGAATNNGTVTAEGATPSVLSYQSLMRMDRLLTDNRTPRQTTVITGSRYIDTKVIPAARIAYVGPDVVPVLRAMKDLFLNPAFIEVQHYADAGTILNGEIGMAAGFRFVQVPEMLKWAGVGAAVTTNPGYQATGGKYDVFPVLVVGDQSFTTVGFQTDGKTVKFDVTTKMPGKETADRNDPYGQTGFSSVQWYYGILVTRPERIGLLKTVAPI